MMSRKYSGFISCVVTAGIGAFVAMWLLDFAIIRANWCIGAETQCVREWIGALSGWVAALAAGLTVYLTLPHLKQQASETKRQTDFALGDSLPTFDVYSEEFLFVYFRVVNWNRRTILLDEIKFSGINYVEVVTINITKTGMIPISRFNLPENNQPIFNEPIRIPGYENRSEQPYACTVKARVLAEEGMGMRTSNFQVQGRILGEYHEEIVLHAMADVRPFWP